MEEIWPSLYLNLGVKEGQFFISEDSRQLLRQNLT